MGRQTLWHIVLIIVFVLIGYELIKKGFFAYPYFKILSESNKTVEKLIIAPRGVLYDRDGRLLVGNKTISTSAITRTYAYPKATSHLLGYLSLPNDTDLKDYSCGAPALTTQLVGKTGLEKYYECRLRGRTGSVLYEVDAQGKTRGELAQNEPQDGENITLSISLPLQRAAEKAFGKQRGAIIASNPKTGEILLFYSSPTYDPGIFVQKDGSQYQSVANDPDRPLFNRLTSGTYPPGSTIKPFVAISALEESVITLDTEFEDTGIFKLGGSSFGNWYYLQYGKKEGAVNVERAIIRSNDIFFYQTGLKLGVEHLKSWLHTFRLDETDIKPYFSESTGVIPDEAWKMKALREEWYSGDTVNMSIGQGYTLVNPVQLQAGTALLANGGNYCKFRFEKDTPTHCESLDLKQEYMSAVTKGMQGACATGGTGWPFFDYAVKGKRIDVACKTGTAESEQGEALPHAWFIAFAPVSDPEIAITVLVENGGEGSSVAAPIAKDILTTYFSQK
ncbi:MAG: penicillin-binding transpeptidase domain-containing protein [Patescibacteria group bacterium]|jgi:penicillin-binding protein 2